MSRICRLAATFILLATAFALSAAADDAKATFSAKCSVCHGNDGHGNTAPGKKLGAHDFQSPDVVKMSDTELSDIIKNGKNKMPAYKGKLSDDQIKALLAYIRNVCMAAH